MTANLATVWAALDELSDPEIPVLTLRDLGIVRDVREAADGRIEVVITPTYSGCPAISQIEDDVRATLRQHGSDAQVSTQLAPAWTTDWMSESGKEKLRQSTEAELAAIAEKSVKEVRYHLQHSRGWLVRLGDGTEESQRRMQAALDHLYAYTREFWAGNPLEAEAVRLGVDVDVAALKADWDAIVDAALAEATLVKPEVAGYITEGKRGIHSEHLGYLLAEMQSLARAHPNAVW